MPKVRAGDRPIGLQESTYETAGWIFLPADVDFAILRSSSGEGALAPAFATTLKDLDMQKITPFLWYAKEAEEAATFYASVFPDSRVVRVVTMPSESPSGPPGSVKVVDFVLFGQSFTAMSAGPLDPFNHAVSFVVDCDDQAEIDKYWNALLGNGGTAEQCGWLRDRYGLSWQIVPKMLGEMMSDPDRAKAKRVTDAMLKMVKIDIAALKAAAQAG